MGVGRRGFDPIAPSYMISSQNRGFLAEQKTTRARGNNWTLDGPILSLLPCVTFVSCDLTMTRTSLGVGHVADVVCILLCEPARQRADR
jgi:hypothetical protein